MSGPAMPKPDAATLARREEIVADMRVIVPGEGVVEIEKGELGHDSGQSSFSRVWV